MDVKPLFKPASPKQQKMFDAALNTDISIIGGSAGCVPYDAEFLTPFGWKKIGEFKRGDMVAQVKITPYKRFRLSFTKSAKYVKLPNDGFHPVATQYGDFWFSKEHRVPHYNREGELLVKRMAELGYDEKSFPTLLDGIKTPSDIAQEELGEKALYLKDEKTLKKEVKDFIFEKGEPNKKVFSVSTKAHADYLQFLLLAVGGINSTIGKAPCKRGNPLPYEVRCINTYTTSKFQARETKPEGKFKYCFTVPDSYFLMRWNGRVLITGNSGKSYLMQLMPLAFADCPHFRGVMFRRTTAQLSGLGGLWETAKEIYSELPIEMRPIVGEKEMKLTFPRFNKDGSVEKGLGAVVKYNHMQHEKDKLNHQGLQYTFVGFDEGTHFSWEQITYLMSRLRSKSKYRSRMVISCNPDPDHKLKEIISWWLDVDGDPIPERDGVKRYFVQRDGEFQWADTAEELQKIYGEYTKVLSLTFVSATIYDNPPLLENAPEYLAFLEGLPPVEKAQLLYGNWNARATGANYFKRENLEIVTTLPQDILLARGWDLASQPVTETNKNADFTAGVKMGKSRDGYYYLIGDYCEANKDSLLDEYGRFRERVGTRDNIILEQAHFDGLQECMVVLPVDPAAAGVAAFEGMAKRFMAEGVRVAKDPIGTNQSKLKRFQPFADAVEVGLVRLYKPSFDEKSLKSLLDELERFDGGKSGTSAKAKDDRVDAVSSAFNYLTSRRVVPLLARNQIRARAVGGDRFNLNMQLPPKPF